MQIYRKFHKFSNFKIKKLKNNKYYISLQYFNRIYHDYFISISMRQDNHNEIIIRPSFN